MFLSIIVPLYNEETNISILHEKVSNVFLNLSHQFELIFINDGSTDHSLQVLKSLSEKDERVKYVSFSNNFGKESAMYCGLEHSNGDAIIIMDSDLQHPPEIIPKLIQLHEEGFSQVVALRNRKNESFIKKIPAKVFYKLSQYMIDVKLKSGEGDFRLISKEVANSILKMTEYNRFSKGIFEWVGFSKTTITFDHQERNDGYSKFSIFKLIDYAIDGIISFNNKPLRLCFYFGGFTMFICLLYIFITFINILLHGIEEPGYFTIISAILFLGGLQLFSLGVIGEYIGRIYYETKDRPKYIIEQSNLKKHE
ncbi:MULTISPECIES: glycosyltransferase family 2 protein [Mammaliicoccus]|uniref:Glycosyltransferase family 2 protein n=1 Tax=Mammaliicoccus fleurettii TaxID=150056 RepID=A0ABS5MJ51_9STAP|nr:MULTISPECIES: glycosyltransferase family 2 protein [Mammaliicoccus]MBL0846898.1 glycosyltransferase family 2 protein [Mammaliicoccus fleurettii]MBS3670861.1 glycosyltransferase family 2 protein [Mammaliicoccus fleurettii]MBS3695920.1 glycosyltransferase family 2 protein [Mammaliicoccus fleurettii]PTE32081.1 glycosyltransferase [Mammaliicoccus fleurettii]RIL53359.1 glycosyltransferase [Mammaliicoccus fleurettii]